MGAFLCCNPCKFVKHVHHGQEVGALVEEIQISMHIYIICREIEDPIDEDIGQYYKYID